MCVGDAMTEMHALSGVKSCKDITIFVSEVQSIHQPMCMGLFPWPTPA